MNDLQAGELSQWLGALAAPAEELGSQYPRGGLQLFGTQLWFQEIQCTLLASAGTVRTWCTGIHVDNTFKRTFTEWFSRALTLH